MMVDPLAAAYENEKAAGAGRGVTSVTTTGPSDVLPSKPIPQESCHVGLVFARASLFPGARRRFGDMAYPLR
jgi:hypothetical protein